jgi:hypothetical protein
MEHPDRIEEQMLRNEAKWASIFNKLIGGGKKQGIARALGNGQYAIGDNKIFKLLGVTEDAFLNYDWVNGSLSFLAKGTWIAKELYLQISGGVEQLISFTGEWMGGDFTGHNFIGKFHGGRFTGGFISNYKNYLADPSTFVQGAVASFTEGVLGMTKLDVTSLNAASMKKSVSLLEIQENYYCNLTDENGTTHSFKVLKSCNDTSMDFELQEETGQKRAIRLSWSAIRKSDDPNMFRRLSTIRIGMKLQIPYLFANDRVGAIKDIEISTKPTMFGSTVDTYKLDLSLLRPMTFPVPDVTIHLFSPEEVVKYGKIYQDLVNNGMQLHMRNILDGIKFGIITGWDGYPHLAPLFGNRKGGPLNHPKYSASMAWLDEFVQLVILRMVKSRTVGRTYLPNEARRAMVMSKLSELIQGAMPAQQPVAQPNTQQTSSKSTGNPTGTGNKKNRTMIP